MLFLVLALAVGRHVLLAKLSSSDSYGELSSYASQYGATLRPLDPYSKRGLYFRISDNATFVPDSTSGNFVVETVDAYVSHVNDPYIAFAYDAQLGTITGQVEPSYAAQSKYLSYINLPKAWAKVGKGRSGQIISIVDSGRFEVSNDLTNHWVNTGDPAPGDGIDNDNDGYIDDFRGWNAVDDNNNASEPGSFVSSSNVYFSHGSAVWTTAAAPENNYGIVGVAPASSVVFVKAGRMEGNNVYFYPDDLIAAMDYLYALVTIRNVDIRVQVASYGGAGYSSILESAINEAIGTKVLFVTSAGNYNSNVDTNPIYPCRFSLNAKLCVGAVDLNGARSSYSNYGTAVDLSAPGTVVAPVHRANGQEILASVSGTSFSCPLVAGAAEILAHAYPSLTPVQIASCLKRSARKTGKYLGTSSNGVLDVMAAVTLCSPPSPPPRRPNDAGSGSIFTLLPLLLLQ